MEKMRKVSYSTIILVVLSAIFVYSTSTFLRLQYSFYLAVCLYGGFILITYSMGYKWRALFSPLTIWFFFCLCASGILLYVANRDIWVVHLSGYIHIFFWTSTYVFLVDNYPLPMLDRFVRINLFLLAIGVIATIRATSLYPLAARGLYGYADGIENIDFLHKIGCGGFGFIYGFVFVVVGFIATVTNKKKKKSTKLIYALLAIGAMYMILRAGFTMAILFTLGAASCCWLYARNNDRFGFMWLIFIGIIVVGFNQEIVKLLQELADFLGVDIVSEKMDKIMSASDSKNYMELERLRVYSISVKGFFENPITGSGYAGMDSQILSILSYIGITGFVYIGLLHNAFSIFRIYTHRKFINIMEVVALSLAVLNPFNDMTLMSIVFMFAPLLLYIAYPEKI